MKKLAMVLAIALLGGCAATPLEFRPGDVREPMYLRAERSIPLTFPKIQMALFKHKAACGWGPEFVLDPEQTAYATIYYKPSPTAKPNRTMIADLTFLANGPVRAQVYSYYADVDQQVNQLFSAILHPTVCP